LPSVLLKEFTIVKGIGLLAEKMRKMKNDIVYSLIYSFVTLSLIMPIATTAY
jgi:hypothetical protein